MIEREMRIILIAAVMIAAAITSNIHRFDAIPSNDTSFVMDVSSAIGTSEMFYTQGSTSDPNHRAIMMMARTTGGWAPSRPVAFSGQWRDLEEVISPDGRTMIFASNRPSGERAKPIDGFFGGKPQPGRGGNLWRVTRNGSQWGNPQRLPDAVNANTSVFSPALTADGTLYFMRMSDPGPHFHLYVARLENGEYRSAQPAPFGDPRYSDFDPTVASDNSFVVFGSNRPPAKPGTSDLFISFNRNGTWTPAEDMGASINPNGDATEPRLSPDARTLYFSSQNVLWSADITPWLDGGKNLPKPVVFEPSILTDALTPSFEPGERAMLFTRTLAGRATIVESQRQGDRWSAPSIVSFSGASNDMDPAISSDGSFVIFASLRSGAPSAGAFLWRADRTDRGWSAPKLLPSAVNIAPNIFAPSVAADGTVYFLHSSKTREHQLYRATLRNGSYERAAPLSFSSPVTMDADPATSLDQSFLVFVSRGRRGPLDMKSHLYIAYNCGTSWSAVQPLRYDGDYDSGADDTSPSISSDSHTLYFTNSGEGASKILSIPINVPPSGCS